MMHMTTSPLNAIVASNEHHVGDDGWKKAEAR